MATGTKKGGRSAFGTSADQIIPTLRMLGDVGGALQIPSGDLAYLFGTAGVQGRLFMNDINQLTNRGVPVIKGLADVMGVAETEVRKLVESGAVGFSQLEAVFKNLTSAGGMAFEGTKRSHRRWGGCSPRSRTAPALPSGASLKRSWRGST